MKWKEHSAGVVSVDCLQGRNLKLGLKECIEGGKWSVKEAGTSRVGEQGKESNVLKELENKPEFCLQRTLQIPPNAFSSPINFFPNLWISSSPSVVFGQVSSSTIWELELQSLDTIPDLVS